ncbi:MAG: helix-turn-helix domain-containing protein, partial [Afipia sp.]|nr:helix-turn-helix domain-containing protein [Afipia sp.]
MNAGDAASLAEDPGIHSSVLRRECQNIESKLSDPNLNLVDVARTEGVSPRYLQRLFEKVDESFSHYVLKRRLDRSAGYLVDPKYERLSISEVSFACGFNDPAHFSRTFRARFGTSPKDYRKNKSRAVPETARAHRGWPSNVRVDNRAQGGEGFGVPDEPFGAVGPIALADDNVSHFLRATPKSVHWGFFSRSIPPVIEVKSGDLVTVETLTQHANDDYERMIAGDADAEDVFLWTAEKKSIDRR